MACASHVLQSARRDMLAGLSSVSVSCVRPVSVAVGRWYSTPAGGRRVQGGLGRTGVRVRGWAVNCKRNVMISFMSDQGLLYLYFQPHKSVSPHKRHMVSHARALRSDFALLPLTP